MSRWIGGGYVCYFVVCFFHMSPDAVVVAGWWTPVAVVLAFVPGWVMLVATFTRPRVWLATALPLACGAGYLAAIGLWFVAWNGGTLAADNATWLVLFPGLASLALVVGRWPLLACPHLLVVIVAGFVANALTDVRPDRAVVFAGSVAWAIAFSAVFVAAGIMAVRTGDVLDVSRERVYRIAADAAAQRARDRQRARYDAVVHDRVLAVLLNVRPDGAHPGPAAQARRVMLELDDALTDAPSHPVNHAGLLAVVRATVADVDCGIAVTDDRLSTDTGTVVPGVVADALANAAAEAVRNCLRHAGPDATVEVFLDADERQSRVTVLDDGCGFDPSNVSRDRMGLAVSIRSRLAAVGGRAFILSRPGHGTRVVLQWPDG